MKYQLWKIYLAFESFQFRLTRENKGLQNLLIWLNLNDQNVPCSQSKVKDKYLMSKMIY